MGPKLFSKSLGILIFLFALTINFNKVNAQTRTFTTYSGSYSSTFTYNIGDMVNVSGAFYISVVSNNLDNNPTTVTNAWTLISGSGSGSSGNFISATATTLPTSITSAPGLLSVAGGTFGSAAFTSSSNYDPTGTAANDLITAESAFTGDVTKTAGSFATTVAKVNGASLPISAAFLGTNTLGQLISVSAPSGSTGTGTINSGTAYSPAYYSATGTTVSGVTPFTGIGYWSTAAAPTAATSTQIQVIIGASVYDAYGAGTTAQNNAEAAFTGDITKSALSFATKVVQVEGGAIPVSASYLGTNTLGQLVAVSAPSGGSSVVTSLTTTGTGGAATLLNGVLNIPDYASTTGGVVLPSTNGLLCNASTSSIIGCTYTQVEALLNSDTVNNSVTGYHLGSGGDSTVPAPISGAWFRSFIGGMLQDSHNGDAYVPSFPLSCQPGIGDGYDVIPANEYITLACHNDTGHTWTITSISCIEDTGASTCIAQDYATGNNLLTGAITGGSMSYAAGTLSTTTTIPPGDLIIVGFITDGTSHTIGIDISGWY